MAVTRRACSAGLVAAVLLAAGRDGGAQQATDSGARTRGLMPAGFGSLRRDDVALEVRDQGLTIRAIPLDESVIRALAPDSYQALHAVRLRAEARLRAIAARTGLPAVQAWYVQFFNVQQGEARYDPRGMIIRSAGRDFRPLDVVPLVPGYDDGRLAQSRMVDAVFAFDPAVSLEQPLTVTLGTQQAATWEDALRRLERERAAVWSRAAAARKPDSAGDPRRWR